MSADRFLTVEEQRFARWVLDNPGLVAEALQRGLDHWPPATTPERLQERRRLHYAIAALHAAEDRP